jgi:hypothetical protein
MREIDVGDPAPAVFTHLERDLEGRPVAAFVSRDGEAFCLAREEVELRIRFLQVHGRDTDEERRALKALRRESGTLTPGPSPRGRGE